MPVYVDNDNFIELRGLRDAYTDNYLNDADVELVTITDPNGDEITGMTFPVLMAPTGSNGIYRVTIPETADFTAGVVYTAKVQAEEAAAVYIAYPQFVAEKRRY